MTRSTSSGRLLRLAAVGLAFAAAAPATAAAAPSAVDFDYVASTVDGRQAWRVQVLARTQDARPPAQLSLSRCDRDGTACAALGIVSTDGLIEYDVPLDEEEGTVFEATATDGGDTTTRRTEPFGGATFVVRSGPHVSVVPWEGPYVGAEAMAGRASWQPGGFWPLSEGLQLQACDAAGASCRVLAQRLGVMDLAFPGAGPVKLTDGEVGTHLYSVAVAGGLGALRVPPVVLPPEQLRPWPHTGAWTSTSLPVGPVLPAPVQRDPQPQPEPERRPAPPKRAEPRAKIARRLRSRGPRTLAVVRCAQACRIATTARHGRRSVTVRASTKRSGTVRVTISRTAIRRLGGRTLRVVVKVDGKARARGQVAVAPALLSGRSR